ncbi:uncharacterized protein SCHCODRAFT_02698552 [Schizophyllum commune H4-8]|uniref:uncharacterized protein n=1 Tax=Schizophyllum commune (strain H4-8 / FGSC 9210) TaxID=578458 RepID=UPI002160C69A|nr:uncharacterized protein SCHCODRAFT_02698552 [Schizophyllum commune H4-8]KAI5897262.1 hypothetical protein SCHCODRAFT_02698552 [Schizophyllum commune H4-8]
MFSVSSASLEPTSWSRPRDMNEFLTTAGFRFSHRVQRMILAWMAKGLPQMEVICVGEWIEQLDEPGARSAVATLNTEAMQEEVGGEGLDDGATLFAVSLQRSVSHRPTTVSSLHASSLYGQLPTQSRARASAPAMQRPNGKAARVLDSYGGQLARPEEACHRASFPPQDESEVGDYEKSRRSQLASAGVTWLGMQR